MFTLLKNSPLFANMTEKEIEDCLHYSGSEIVSYEKDEIIFYQQDKPQKLHLLIEGSVVIGSDSMSGKRNIIATFNHAGELFGEVFLFLQKEEYDNYAQAATAVKVLEMPKEFLYPGDKQNHPYHNQIISNMLAILAKKAYYLNKKLQIMSGMTLRQKIIKLLMQNCQPNGQVNLRMNREELADFLNTARPSLSRELMKMQEEKLIKIEKKSITILNKENLQQLL